MMLINPYGTFGSGGGGSDPHFASVAALLHMDGADASTTFTDVKGSTWTRFGNAQIDTAQSKFGGASGLFDGTGDYIETGYASALDLSTGDFTVEWWMRPNSIAVAQAMLEMRPDASQAAGLVVTQSGADPTKVRFNVGDSDSTNYESIITSTTSVATGTWYHVACVRSGSTFYLFLDGVSQGTGTFSGTIYINSSNPRIGAARDGTLGYNGWLDDFRITKGVARYTSNFTPPTAAFPNS